MIIGDSYAEGTCNIEDRLDRLIEVDRPTWTVALLGCGGFGTDQEFIMARAFLNDLRAGDVFVRALNRSGLPCRRLGSAEASGRPPEDFGLTTRISSESR